jgi:hypothetical protein
VEERKCTRQKLPEGKEEARGKRKKEEGKREGRQVA